jgi:hypothetical protein
MTHGLHSWPTPLQALALVVSSRLVLRHSGLLDHVVVTRFFQLTIVSPPTTFAFFYKHFILIF